jgi:glycosyltransferase involved in cell wall biosynthesis
MKDQEQPLAVSIVIPVFDEVENIVPLHTAICEAMLATPFEVLYVNDGSRDESGRALDQLSRTDSRVRVIHFVRNYGQTAALTAGIRHAEAPLLVTMDADLQNDPADIPQMLEHIGEYDVVCGWRKDRKDPFLSRTLPSRIANWLISRLSKVYLHDYGCTLRVYRREYIKDIPLYGEMHRFIPIYVTWAGARIVEVPVRHHPRTRGVSKYGLSRIPKVLLDLTTVKFLRDFYVTPIYFFGWVGFLLVFAGLLTGTAAAWLWTQPVHQLMAACLTVVSPMLAIFGVVEVTLGIIAEVLIRMHYEILDKEPYRIRRTSNLVGVPGLEQPPPESNAQGA